MSNTPEQEDANAMANPHAQSVLPWVLRLKRMGEQETAVNLIKALARHAFHYEEYSDLAQSAFRIKEYQLSMELAEKAFGAATDNLRTMAARSNLINVYNHANYPERALRLLRAQAAVMPNDSSIQLDASYAHFLMGNRDEAEKLLRKELLRTDLTEDVRTKINFNLGTYNLYRDDLLYGLELFLLEGRKLDIWRKPKIDGTVWIGQPPEVEGQKMYIYAEGGLGDEIINIRFMTQLSKLGFDPIWCTNSADLAEVLVYSGFQVDTDPKTLTRSDPNRLWAYSMSLPLYLQCETTSLWSGPYLKANPDVEGAERIWLGDGCKTKPILKIGVRWQGNPEYDQDLHRNLPLSQLLSHLPSAAMCAVHSLQRDTGLDQLTCSSRTIQNLEPHLTSWERTLHIISRLDVVVTSCTSVAHASAALGKRTFVLVPLSAYYVWCNSSEHDSPWYGPHVTVLRQTHPRSWTEPLSKLQSMLHELAVSK
jgi:tetratricopeptide (TPR) repeat protein